MEDIPTFFQNLSDAEFNKQLQSLIENKLTEHQSLPSAARAYWSELSENRYDFRIEKTQASLLKDFTKDKVAEFSRSLFQEGHRKLLIVQCSRDREAFVEMPSSVMLTAPTDVPQRYSLYNT